MRIEPMPIPGVCLIDVDYLADERGGFARTWDREAFAAHGLRTDIAQCSISFNHRRGTLRGMHYQAEPHAEVKLVRVTRGAIFDVALDLRPTSPMYCKWFATELTADNRRMLYIPKGCAHGFQTLADNTEVAYQISTAYEPAASRGVRWNDPAFGIAWPLPVSVMHPRDAAYQDFSNTIAEATP